MFEDFDNVFDAAFQVTEPVFHIPMTFDWPTDLYAHLGFLAGGCHFILADDSELHWSVASRLLDQHGIKHNGHPLADGSCLFVTSEADGERAERLLLEHRGRVFHAPLDDILFFL